MICQGKDIVVFEADFFRKHDRRAMAAGRPTMNEETLTFAEDGYQGLFETVKTPMHGTNGELIGVLGIARDISDRKVAEEERHKLENQLHQAQKMESVGRLAGGVAHDFNNILSVIIGYADLAIDEVGPGEALHDDLGEIIKAAHHSRDITRQLLAFARKETISPEVLNLNGRELSNTLTRVYPELRTLFISGYTADVIAHRGILDSDVHFVPKPFSKQLLAASVRSALNRT